MTDSDNNSWYSACLAVNFALGSDHQEALSTTCKTRLKKEVKVLMNVPPSDIFFSNNENEFSCNLGLIIGNKGTPYEGGFFLFCIRVHPNYPAEPPHFCSLTSYRFGSTPRFSPNLYEDGKVCLSILGTWEGPGWISVYNMKTVLQSIQSTIFVNDALLNEPGFNSEILEKRSIFMYDLYVRHETIKVAVTAALLNSQKCGIPQSIIKKMEETFMKYYNYYIKTCNDYECYDGTSLNIPLVQKKFVPTFKTLKLQIILMYNTMEKEGDLKKLYRQ